jgi:hypothetical protein
LRINRAVCLFGKTASFKNKLIVAYLVGNSINHFYVPYVEARGVKIKKLPAGFKAGNQSEVREKKIIFGNSPTLFAETEFLNETTVCFEITALQILEKTSSLTDEDNKSACAVFVFLECFAMLGELQNAFRAKRDLNFCISGVFFIRTEFVYHRSGFFFCKCHTYSFSIIIIMIT